MKYKVILEEGKEATISAECLGDAHTQAIKQWGTSVSGVLEWKEPGRGQPISHTGDDLKYDSGKLRYDLLPIAPVEAIIRVLEHGADKYGIDNWRSLKSQETRLYAAALRHLTAWKKGEKIDLESGLSHLAHCAANLVFMLEFEKDER